MSAPRSSTSIAPTSVLPFCSISVPKGQSTQGVAAGVVGEAGADVVADAAEDVAAVARVAVEIAQTSVVATAMTAIVPPSVVL